MSKSLYCQKSAQVCCGFCSVPMGQVVYRLSRAGACQGLSRVCHIPMSCCRIEIGASHGTWDENDCYENA